MSDQHQSNTEKAWSSLISLLCSSALVPDSVKKELLQRIRAFLAQHSTWCSAYLRILWEYLSFLYWHYANSNARILLSWTVFMVWFHSSLCIFVTANKGWSCLYIYYFGPLDSFKEFLSFFVFSQKAESSTVYRKPLSPTHHCPLLGKARYLMTNLLIYHVWI